MLLKPSLWLVQFYFPYTFIRREAGFQCIYNYIVRLCTLVLFIPILTYTGRRNQEGMRKTNFCLESNPGTKMQNPRRHATCVRTLKTNVLYNAYACFPQENGRPYVCFQRSSAGSLQRSDFRENPTNFLTFVARWVRDSIFRTNRCSRGEV